MSAADHDLDLDASALADWLATHAGDRLWTVDGDPRIMGTVSLPCPGWELAATLRELGGRFRVFAPAGAQASSPDELENLAEVEHGELVFEVAWLSADGTPGARWILAQDTFAEEAERAALAAP